MGLDTTHNCWHGAYSAFMRWREEIAHAAGLPPLRLMEGFYKPDDPINDPLWLSQHEMARGRRDENPVFFGIKDKLPINWECLKPSPLHTLLHHSDCDGEIEWQDCGKIADALEHLLPKLPKEDDCGHIGNWDVTTKRFITGLRDAHKAKENVQFHQCASSSYVGPRRQRDE